LGKAEHCGADAIARLTADNRGTAGATFSAPSW
jgi:hypothetical protein